jgi:hypothetical protein
MIDQLQIHLRKLAAELARFLNTHLPPRGGDNWWETHVLQQLTYGQQGQVRTRGITTLSGLDLNALLRLLDRNWAELSHVAGLPNEARTLGRELVDLRHALAHHASDAGDMPAADAFRHLDTLARFMAALQLDEQALRAVEQARTAALNNLAGPLVPPRIIEREVHIPIPVPPPPRAAEPAEPVSAPPAATIGPFTLHGPGEAEPTVIATFDGREVPATAIPWTAQGPGGLAFLVHVVLIDEGEHSEFGQVFCASRLSSPQQYDDIVQRLRVGIRRLPDGELTMDLRLAVRPNGGRAAKRIVPLAELDAAAHIAVAGVLRGMGATAVDTRAAVFGDTSRARNWPCITFAATDLLTPAAAYVACTLLPLLK